MTGNYRIGVDVGGTNTDAVILDVTPGSKNPVIATHKSPTTSDITTGISSAISSTLSKSNINKKDIQAISIGTTSFVNSLIERDSKKLEKVSVIRLCGPFSRLAPPFISFPYELRHVLEGPTFFAEGGLQVDGSELSTVNPLEIRGICEEIKKQGIQTIAVSACYSPIDREIRQEELVREIIHEELPGVKVCISKEVAHIGLLQRENATILNAALLKFASKTIEGFEQSKKALNLTCPLFLTSNDGTLLTCEMASKFPIKTFSSGPTNSMRGANFLANLDNANGDRRKETALVMDVGGTTTEIGVLLPTGFPRQASAYHELCGVPLNFSMPHVYSIGLGGGSRVRRDNDGTITIGPDSVGYRIHELGIAFGGDVLTTTDIVIADGKATSKSIGNADLVKNIPMDDVEQAQEKIKQMLENSIDSMKTSSEDVPIYLVGGGAILVPNQLKGVSKVHRFPFYDAANAVGAACAQISGVIDTFEDTSKISVEEVQKSVEQRAIDKAVAAGADKNHTVTVESEAIPIAYTTGRCRFYVKAAGEWTGLASTSEQGDDKNTLAPEVTREWDKDSPVIKAEIANAKNISDIPEKDIIITAEDIINYKPNVENNEWILSELDIEWISTGCYILGTGGGGNPHNIYLALREMFRSGSITKVIDIDSLDPKKVVMYGGGIGSPEVAAEKLTFPGGGEAARSLLRFMGMKSEDLGALAAVEIGGGNGMVAMVGGASTGLNVPIIDGDFMGRAYPTGWQTTVNVYAEDDKATMVLPTYMSSGDGTEMILTKVKHYKEVDSILRAGCMEMGTSANVVARPLTKSQVQKALIRNTVSQSWYIGKQVELANKQGNIDNIGSILVNSLGGSKCSKVLFKGKIVKVGRRLIKGHSYGEIEIQALSSIDQSTSLGENEERFEGIMKIPFKNENLLAEHTLDGKTEVVCGVPDLISVLDAQNGKALGTPEYKYGLRVIVLGITASTKWTETKRGLELGSLSAFGYDNIPYKPLGIYVEPKSVIKEYNVNV
ncbi:uncharacterized protein L201_003881 [Kwoniella dendrophila CBS 6074]|uniref:Hydantoinase n=1 Tax=Kwoniella dendrophila CBS 6074 TaxID=1295534 RepID=A0AAX4JU53_9TREE